MANVGTGASGKTLIGAGNGASPTYASIGTNSGLTAHGVVIAEGNGAFVATSTGASGQVLTSNGSLSDPTWQAIPSPFTPNSTVNLFDDFVGAQSPSSLGQILSLLSWQKAQNANQGWTGTPTADLAHPGIIANTIGSSASSQTIMLIDSAAASTGFILGGGALTINWVFKIATASNSTNRYTISFGLGITTLSVDMFDGCYFIYSDNVNSGNWQAKTSSANTRTTLNSSTAVTTGWHNAQITINAAATSVAFSIDGVSLGTAVTTNIPTGNITPYFTIIQSAGTVAANSVLIDLMYLTQTLTSTR